MWTLNGTAMKEEELKREEDGDEDEEEWEGDEDGNQAAKEKRRCWQCVGRCREFT